MNHNNLETELTSYGVQVDDLIAFGIDPSLYEPIEGLNAEDSRNAQLGENGVDDMILLDNLNESSILKNLQLRYASDTIYTYVGSILVAVNSFKGCAMSDRQPHIYAVGEHAYAAMMATGLNQACLVSGESGAGKTESMKFLCRYMAGATKSEDHSIQKKILDSNPVLEAFGNAKTIHNKNSSRFGKFTELQFTDVGELSGAKISEYLLEKSRVTHQAATERNYHVFYHLLAGASSSERDFYSFGNASVESFNYLCGGGCTTIDGLNDAEIFHKLKESMDIFTEAQQLALFSIIAAILHFGNIEFVGDGESDSVLSVQPNKHLVVSAHLFGLSQERLVSSLSKRSNIIKGECMVTPLTLQQAISSRDALAKTCYGRLFSWIVRHINKSISHAELPRSIGVLDIYGFENFKENSFEQFCINFCNEKLQQFFNEFIFKLELMEYKHEQIDIADVTFDDNDACLAMITRRTTGLLAVLDEQSYFPKATVHSFLALIERNCQDSAHFSSKSKSKTGFIIFHYAGRIEYEANNFMEKNRDTLSPDLLLLLVETENSLIEELFPELKDVFIPSSTPVSGSSLSIDTTLPAIHSPESSPRSAGTRKRKLPTVANQFRNSLDELMAALRLTHPHFIRCIKPNPMQIPNDFKSDFVVQQLRCSGMMETVKIRKAGFPVRFVFADFVARFKQLIEPAKRAVLLGHGNDKELCVKLLEHLKLPKSEIRIGKTKVFFRDRQAGILEARLGAIFTHRNRMLREQLEKKKEEALRKAEEEKRKKVEEEQKKAAEEERRKLAEEEQRKIEDQEQRKKAEEKLLKSDNNTETKAESTVSIEVASEMSELVIDNNVADYSRMKIQSTAVVVVDITPEMSELVAAQSLAENLRLCQIEFLKMNEKSLQDKKANTNPENRSRMLAKEALSVTSNNSQIRRSFNEVDSSIPTWKQDLISMKRRSTVGGRSKDDSNLSGHLETEVTTNRVSVSDMAKLWNIEETHNDAFTIGPSFLKRSSASNSIPPSIMAKPQKVSARMSKSDKIDFSFGQNIDVPAWKRNLLAKKECQK